MARHVSAPCCMYRPGHMFGAPHKHPFGPSLPHKPIEQVCLYKITKKANAKLYFDMCTNNKCE